MQSPSPMVALLAKGPNSLKVMLPPTDPTAPERVAESLSVAGKGAVDRVGVGARCVAHDWKLATAKSNSVAVVEGEERVSGTNLAKHGVVPPPSSAVMSSAPS